MYGEVSLAAARKLCESCMEEGPVRDPEHSRCSDWSLDTKDLKNKLTLSMADRQKHYSLVALGQTPIAGLESRITNLSELLTLIVPQCPLL